MTTPFLMHNFQRTAVSDRTVTFAPLPINDISALSLECIAYFVVADSISAYIERGCLLYAA